MKKTIRTVSVVLASLGLALMSGCGTCSPDPKPGGCASQSCGTEGAGNFETNFECLGDDGGRWGWECREGGSNNLRCESYGD